MTRLIMNLPEKCRRLAQKRGAAPAAIAVMTALFITALGLIEPLEHKLMELRFWLADRPATGDIVVVELDNRSLEAMGVWPWPRERHAALIDRLLQAGARGIALDIDFSSASTPQGDAALAGALARADPPVVLPVFKQYASLERREDQLRYTAPLPQFAEQSRLASVNLQPGPDGLVRRYSLTQTADGNLYLSMGAAFAAVDQPSSDGFYLDFGIRPESIPHVSFGDVLSGKVDDAQLRGKLVIVGATAIELGDDVTVPIYRSLPGVTLQALAYESIVQDRMIQRSSPAVTWIIALLLAVIAGSRFSRWPWRRGLLGLLAASAGLIGASAGLQTVLPISLDIVLWIAGAGRGLCHSLDVGQRCPGGADLPQGHGPAPSRRRHAGDVRRQLRRHRHRRRSRPHRACEPCRCASARATGGIAAWQTGPGTVPQWPPAS